MTASSGSLCLVLGAGAQGRVVLEAWRAQRPAGAFVFLDDSAALHGQQILGVPVRGPFALAEQIEGEAVLALGHNLHRLDLAQRWSAPRVRFGQAVHPSAVVAPSAALGPGTVVLARAVINSGASLGAHVLVNTGVIVEHDAIVEDGVSLSPGVVMGGRVQLGRGVFLGVGVTLAPRVRVGAGTIVGAGALVTGDLPPGVLAYGLPARVIRPVSEADWQRVL